MGAVKGKYRKAIIAAVEREDMRVVEIITRKTGHPKVVMEYRGVTRFIFVSTSPSSHRNIREIQMMAKHLRLEIEAGLKGTN